MPQQINLCTAALTPLRQRFQAKSLMLLLAISVVLLGSLGAAWTWSLQRSDQEYQQTLEAQAGEISSLQAAIQRSRANSGPLDPALVLQLQDKHSALLERERLLQAMRLGLLQAGQGHSDRLQLLARSIPADVWVTGLKADSGNFEVSGFTLEPASLNAWVARLGQQSLMRGLQLSTVKVNYVSAAEQGAALAAVATTAAASGTPPMWSFSLLSQSPVAQTGAAATPTTVVAAPPGVKP